LKTKLAKAIKTAKTIFQPTRKHTRLYLI